MNNTQRKKIEDIILLRLQKALTKTKNYFLAKNQEIEIKITKEIKSHPLAKQINKKFKQKEKINKEIDKITKKLNKEGILVKLVGLPNDVPFLLYPCKTIYPADKGKFKIHPTIAKLKNEEKNKIEKLEKLQDKIITRIWSVEGDFSILLKEMEREIAELNI